MTNLSKFGLLLIGLTIVSTFSTMAQSQIDSLISFRQGFGSSSWQRSQNPIFLKNKDIPQFTSVGIYGQQTNGSFKRPQEFKQEQLFGFGAKGVSGFKDWKFYGEFTYGKHYRDSVKYANVARPYDGNPFITADAVGGNWSGDQLAAQLQLAFPKLNRWQMGMKLVYETEQSARDNDPKPLYRLLDYTIEPSIGYSINPQQIISLTGGYLRNYEHTETGYYTDQNPLLYSLRGYGEFSRGPVVSAERFRTGWGWKFGSDYQFKNELTTLSIGARLGFRTADVNDGIAKPLFIGGFDEKSAELYFNFERQHQNNGWLSQLKGWFKDGTGYDPVFKSINPAYYFSGLDGRFSWWQQKTKKTRVGLNFYPALAYTNYFESIAKTDWTSVMLHQDISMSVSYQATNRTTFFTDFLIGYHANLQKELVINRPTLLSPILVQPDFIANSANYIRTALNLSAIYTQGRTSFEFKGGVDLRNVINSEISPNLGSRNLYHVNINFIF